MRHSLRTYSGVLLLLGALALLIAFLPAFLSEIGPSPSPVPSETVTPSSLPSEAVSPSPAASSEPEEVDGLPVGKLVVTEEREAYVDDSLTLYIPALNVKRSVHNGTDDDTLDRGVGLYEYAQLPGEGNRNVSMAGHRNGLSNGKITDRAPFYYIDTLGEGDYLYLYDSDSIYRYLFEYTEIVEADDWDPIRTTGYSCMTITSCHPIGVSDHRIVVRARLDEIISYDSSYAFPSNTEEVAS